MKSHAKINLVLEVTGKRRDGYHNLATVYAPVSLYDDIEIEIAKEGIEIKCNKDDIPVNEGNIIHKVLSFLKRKHSVADGFKIDLHKRIPVKAGLGGGSSNGATAAKWFARTYNIKLNVNEMASLGVDIPYFINGGFQLGKKRGEILKKIKTDIKLSVIIVKPKVGISTKEAFKNVVMTENNNVRPMIKSLKSNDKIGVIANVFNSFEGQVFSEKVKLLGYGFRTVLLCGSGSSFACFGECDDMKFDILRDNYEFVERVFIG